MLRHYYWWTCWLFLSRVGKQRFLSELLVYLENCPPRLVLLFLTIVGNPKIYDLEWKKIIWYFFYVLWFQILSSNSYHTFDNALNVFSTWKKSITELALYNAYSIFQFFVWKRISYIVVVVFMPILMLANIKSSISFSLTCGYMNS